ncbi:amidohydrolase [Marinomonas rhizomae]|uniref:Putative TIM-barrel fold metal-dependent hydrolase n=1 Tax=Marinomonas rhizomae TaxID=491948 RepID=A0A366J7Y1_9GAMM|nr:amidohydrolase family protein [Marinomonas rhizomae]RBP83141.1 putative TIM-barrel fold metal-dependent hydrolase [Marinomonas rhizomae]RNF72559.1 amidohydrolase [Marinomonas rhizomae]
MISNADQPLKSIDTHAHIFRTDLPMSAERRYAPDYNALPEEFLTHLAEHNISHGVLVQPSFLGTDNSYMVQALRQHPNKLKGIAVVNPTVSDLELNKLDVAGVVGVRLNLIKKPLEDYTSPLWKNFLSKLAERKWVVEIQREIDDLTVFLPSILESGVEVIIDHFGRTLNGIQAFNPAHQDFLNLLRSGAPVWTKVSAAYRCNANLEQAQEMLATLRSAYGHSEYLLWGSDWPNTQFEEKTNYTSQYRFMEALLPNIDERSQILLTNPSKLFKFSNTHTE